jgi:hypothetical protein
MFNSTIKPKKKLCKCGCGNTDYIWAKGMIKQCYYRINKPKPIPKVSEKRKETINTKDEKLEQWFKDRALEMTGLCYNCEAKTSKGDIKYQKYSQAHIFAKKENAYPSIKTHPLNFVELCHFNNSCHHNFDANGYEYAKEKMPKLWQLIIKRAKILIPKMTPQEQARVPQIILNKI